MSRGTAISAITGEIVFDEPEDPTPEEILAAERAAAESNRQAAYTQEADPLFFKWQAGEATKEEWEAKREEIRQRFPYPEGTDNE